MNFYRDTTNGKLILRPQNQPDRAEAEKLCPHDLRTPAVMYWRDGNLHIEQVTPQPATISAPDAKPAANDRNKLMRMPAAEFEVYYTEKGFAFESSMSRTAMVEAILKGDAARA